MIPSRTIRNLRLRYIVGLSVIALLVTASFITMQRVVSEQRGFARLVNLAGHQSGLSNRIAYFASSMAYTLDETEFSMAKAQVGRTMNKMKTAHQILRYGSEEEEIPLVTNTTLLNIYDSPKMGLDMALASFLERANTVYEGDMESVNPDSEAYIFLTTYGPHVLEPLLDAAVDEYEQIGHAAIVRIEGFEFAIWLLAIITLICEVWFIFHPLEKSVRNVLRSLGDSIDELRNTRQRLLLAQKMALVGDWQYDLEQGVLSWSDQVGVICGELQESVQKTLLGAVRLIHPSDRGMIIAYLRSIGCQPQSMEMEYRIIRSDGMERLVYQHTVSKAGEDGKVELISATIQDITERKELSTRLEKLSEHIPGFIFQFHLDRSGKSHMPYASKGIENTCGITPHAVLKDSTPIYDLFHVDDTRRIMKTILLSSKKLETWHDQYRICHPQKGYLWLEGHATPERLVDGSTLWNGYIWDITERKKRENQIKKLALYDPLTGLANRRLLHDRLTHAIATSRRNHHFGAIIMVDLDNFKALNDTKGHDVGDSQLVEVAKRLHDCVRETDTIARLGGDEFVVILEWLGKKKTNAKTKAKDVAEKIRAALSRAYILCDNQYIHHASGSIGVAMFQDNRLDCSELLKRADVAMYEAKELGRNRVCLYSEKRQAVIDKQSSLAHDMQLGLEMDEFSLFLQPQFSANGQLCGAEALLRWLPVDREPISPGAFIPVAESTGFILQLGEWVLKKACENLLDLMNYPLPEAFTLSVNISAKQFNDDGFIEKVKNIVTSSGVDIRRLKFELTESCLVQDLDHGRLIVTELRKIGLHVELDDFGIGYSSLHSLNELPLSTLKIDKSLIHAIEGKSCNKAIVRAVIAMAKAMSLTVIAEGVETTRQSEFLVAEGCDILQGFLYGQPMCYQEFLVFLNQGIDNTVPAFKKKSWESKVVPEVIHEPALNYV